MKRLLVCLLSVSILVCCIWLTASAETEMVQYVDANGVPQAAVEATIVDADNRTWNTGWYAITGEVTINARIETNGDINLILTDGCKLDTRGINVAGSSSLTIWGQTKGTGELIAIGSRNAGYYEAGIGGYNNNSSSNNRPSNGKIVINGGTITATAGNWSAGIGGAYEGSGNNITINGGFVTATGHHGGAGIGGGEAGNYGSGGNASNITITGGTVVAKCDSSGYHGGAGIGSGACGVYGSGNSASNITINGGNVTAIGGNGAAGIGGGYGSSGSDIIITSGIVNATGGSDAAGIGGGMTDTSRSPYKFGKGSAINISGDAKVKATGANDGAGIGGGYYGAGSDISISGNTYVEAIGGSNGKGIGGGDRGTTSGIVFYGGTTIAMAGIPDLHAIGTIPSFSDFLHVTYGNENDNTPTTTAVEWTGNANEEWAWPWVKIQPATLEFTFNPTNPTVILDGKSNGVQTFTLGYTATLADGTSVALAKAAPTWSVSGSQNASTSIDASGKLTVAADERAAALTVTASLNGTTYTTQVTVQQPTYTVTFDSGVSAQTVSRYKQAIEPTAPSRAGYIFAGWYNNGVLYDFSTEVIGNLTLIARWTENTAPSEDMPGSSATHPSVAPDATHVITLDPNGGSCHLGSLATTADGTLPPLPTAARKGYTFDGWFTKREGGERVMSTTVFTSDTTVYAHWIEIPKTGDETPLALWALLVVLALGGMLFSSQRPIKHR